MFIHRADKGRKSRLRHPAIDGKYGLGIYHLGKIRVGCTTPTEGHLEKEQIHRERYFEHTHRGYQDICMRCEKDCKIKNSPNSNVECFEFKERVAKDGR